jgi:hypothetical protein
MLCAAHHSPALAAVASCCPVTVLTELFTPQADTSVHTQINGLLFQEGSDQSQDYVKDSTIQVTSQSFGNLCCERNGQSNVNFKRRAALTSAKRTGSPVFRALHDHGHDDALSAMLTQATHSKWPVMRSGSSKYAATVAAPICRWDKSG